MSANVIDIADHLGEYNANIFRHQNDPNSNPK